MCHLYIHNEGKGFIKGAHTIRIPKKQYRTYEYITHIASKMEQFRCDLGRVFSFQNVFHTLNPFLRFVISFSVALKSSNISHTVVSVFFQLSGINAPRLFSKELTETFFLKYMKCPLVHRKIPSIKASSPERPLHLP